MTKKMYVDKNSSSSPLLLLLLLLLVLLLLLLLLLLLFFFAYLPSPNLGLTPSGTYKPNARGSDACRGSNSLWTRTLDRYARAGLPEWVVSTMSGLPPKTTQDRTQTKDTHPMDRKHNSWPRRESNPGRRVGRQGLYWPRHDDGLDKS